MDILFLSESSYPRHPGGAGKSTHMLATGLAKRGHTVRIVCESREETEIERIDDVEVHRVRLSEPRKVSRKERENIFAKQFLSHIHRQIPAHAIDMVHDSGGFLSFFYPVSYQLRQSLGIPVVLHFRYLLGKHLLAFNDKRPLTPFSKFVLRLEANIDELTQAFPTRFSDALICPSKDDAEFVDQSYKPAGGYPNVIPDPVDLNLYELSTRHAVRKDFELPDNPILLFGGRIDSELKGGDLLLPAFRKLQSSYPDIFLVLLGKRDSDFKPFQKEFGNRIISIGWIRDSAKIAKLFRAVDIVVIPSRYESFGMMCAEAMAAGTPVIASPVGGMTDMVRQGENGFLLSPGNSGKWPEEIFQYTNKILHNPDFAHKMAMAARQYAQENLDIPVISKQIEHIYTRVIEQSEENSRGDIVPPKLSQTDERHYLDMLERLVGTDVRTMGKEVLLEWQNNLSERCLGCTRKRMAQNTMRLMSLNKKYSIQRLFQGEDKKIARTHQIIHDTCPMGLIQKHHLLSQLHGDP